MGDGESGQGGKSALLLVVVVTKEGPDHAITQPHNLMVTIVLLMAHPRLKVKDAMKTHVPVCGIME